MKKSKKGSSTVFVLVIMTGLLTLFTVYIGAVREQSVAGSVNALGRLWADSVIAEYDRRLYGEYGIFAYLGTPGETEEKILEMAEYTFAGKDYADVGICICLPEEYSLAAAENFKEQVVSAGKASEIDLVIQDFTDPFTGETAETPGSEERAIRNQRVINSLPSHGRSGEGFFERAGEFFKSLGSLGGAISEGTDLFFIDRYIKTHFRNQLSDKSLENRFLVYEEEYILFGKTSDAANRRAAKAAIIGIREVMNFAYLNTCETKKNEALALGAVLLPEAPEAMQQTLLAGWALAESFNDYELLMRARPVPFMKDDESWATTITNALDGVSSGYIDTGCESGGSYEDHLSALMCLLPEDIKLLRMMDLIQINLKYTYRADFLITDCYVGVDYLIEVNGKSYAFSAEY